MKTISNLLCVLILSLVFLPKNVHAVPPPDFIIQVASQLGNFFAIIVAFLITILSVSYQFIKFHYLKYKKVYWVIGIISTIIVAGVSSYYLDIGYRKKATEKATQEWMKESEIYAEKGELVVDATKANEISNLNIAIKPKIPTQKIENNQIALDEMDLGESFIRNYYSYIAKHEFEKAYDISKKSVSLDTFSGWYKDTTKINVEDIVKIDNSRYSLELTLYEDSKPTYYGVLTTLEITDGTPVRITDSQVKELESLSKKIEVTAEEKIEDQVIAQNPELDFWKQNKATELEISNEDFEKILKSDDDYIVLDAREDIEYENGSFPDSTHIRYADLQAGRWIEIPNDKFIYVICWSGIRGKEVAEYLRGRNIIARYLVDGANGWVQYGGTWEGNIKFTETYTADRYKKVFTTDVVKELVSDGALLVDSRPPSDFAKKELPGSVNIPLMHTPTNNLENTFAQLPKNGEVITICDDYVDCFDAKLTGVELERRGYTFLGRYNRPWEY